MFFIDLGQIVEFVHVVVVGLDLRRICGRFRIVEERIIGICPCGCGGFRVWRICGSFRIVEERIMGL